MKNFKQRANLPIHIISKRCLEIPLVKLYACKICFKYTEGLTLMGECRQHAHTQTNPMRSANGGSQHEYFKKGVVQDASLTLRHLG